MGLKTVLRNRTVEYRKRDGKIKRRKKEGRQEGRKEGRKERKKEGKKEGKKQKKQASNIKRAIKQ